MSSSSKTPHYNLSQFADTDKPTWRGDYNGDMTRIDAAINNVSGQTVTAMTAATNAQSAVGAVKTTADANKQRLTEMGVTDTATASAFKPLPGNVSKVSTDLATLSSHVNNDFVTKTTYNAGIAAKADKSDVYTKAESDAKYLTKTNVVVIGDSYMTGYQPTGTPLAESARIPQVMAAKLNADLHVFAANAAGYAKAGDGGKTFSSLVSDAKTSLGSSASSVTDVVIAGGRNDTGDIQTTSKQVINSVLSTFANARVWVFFLYDNNSIADDNATTLASLRQAVASDYGGRAVHWVANAPFYGLTFTSYFANNGGDIHPNTDGARHYGTLMANVLGGAPDDVVAFGTAASSATNVTGNFKWRMSNGVLSLTAKFSCSSAVTPGTQIAQLPKCFNLGDGFVLALINAGDKIAYLHLQDGKLLYTGATGGGGDMSGNCWIGPTAWTPIANL